MASESGGDRYHVRIGGDAAGPVVVGHHNDIRATGPGPEGGAPDQAEEAEESAAARSTQTSTARDNGTVYAVANGDMHIYHHEPDAE